MASPAESMIELAKKLEYSAEWRREKAAEYPDDSRNVEAASLLDRLAEQCLDTDETRQGEYVTAFVRFYSSTAWDFPEFERFNTYLREIGFHHWPDNPEALCEDILNALGVDLSEAA